MTATETCNHCGKVAKAKPVCWMCHRPIEDFPDDIQALLEEHGYRKADTTHGPRRWTSPGVEPRLEKIANNVEHVRDEATGKLTGETIVTPHYQMVGRVPCVVSEEEAVRSVLAKVRGPRPTIHRQVPAYSDAEIATLEQQSKARNGGFLRQGDKDHLEELKARTQVQGIAPCPGCQQYPNGFKGEV